MASTGTKTKSPKKNRGIVWADEATEVLIELWGEETIQLALENAKCAKETREVYRRVKVQMENRGFLFRLEDIINKMKKLRQKYKIEKDKSNRSGRGRRKAWKFFRRMDEILGHRPYTQPPACLDSSLVIVQDAESGGGSDTEDHGEETMNRESEVVEPHDEKNEIDDTIPNCDDQEVSGKPSSHAERNTPTQSTKLPAPRKKNLSNFEKGISLMCATLNETSKREMEQSLNAEKERYQQDMDFQLRLMELENQRRLQEREHEIKLFSLLVGNNMQSRNVSEPPVRYGNQIPENFGGFPHGLSYVNNSSPMTMSDASSDTTSSAQVDEGLRSYYSL